MLAKFRQEFSLSARIKTNTRQLSNKVKSLVPERAKKWHLIYSVIVLICLIAWSYQSLRILQDYLRFRSHKITKNGFNLFTMSPAITFSIDRIFDFDVVNNHFLNWTQELSNVYYQMTRFRSYRHSMERWMEYEALIKVYQNSKCNASQRHR